jgi:hypothetical protein
MHEILSYRVHVDEFEGEGPGPFWGVVPFQLRRNVLDLLSYFWAISWPLPNAGEVKLNTWLSSSAARV